MPNRSAYGTVNPNAGRPANGDIAAWGGYQWPNGVPSNRLGRTANGVLVRVELVELWNTLFEIAKEYKYTVYTSRGGENWGPWGYENRPISGTNRPSGHSAGLSVDINAPLNPYSFTFESDMPVGMVLAYERCGMYWGGRYEGQRYDAMHFGYCWQPNYVTTHLDRARDILASLRGNVRSDWFTSADTAAILKVIGEGIRASL